MRAWLLLPFLLLSSGAALAADACPQLSQQTPSDVATRIAAVACREHLMWYRPFIDRNGRMANAPMMEAESSLLSIGDDRAWQRVARYWRDSGLLGAIGHRRGATECLYASATGPQAEACRGFVVDTPWSAAFISWVMREARVPGFRGSSRHFTYVQAAFQNPSTNAFDVIDVAKAKPVVGDLICYVRQSGRLFGHEGLLPVLRSGSPPQNSPLRFSGSIRMVTACCTLPPIAYAVLSLFGFTATTMSQCMSSELPLRSNGTRP